MTPPVLDQKMYQKQKKIIQAKKLQTTYIY